MDENDIDKAESLENQDIAIEGASTAPQSNGTDQRDNISGVSKSKKWVAKVALICLFVLFLIAIIGILLFKLKDVKSQQPQKVTINTQSLDNGTLNKVTNTLGKNSQVQQQLTITPSTLFKNNVNVQGAFSTEGNLTVKGATTLIGPVATGNNLTVGGGLTVSRNASVAGGLSVTGAITAGSLNVASINLSTLSLSGNFSWGGHLLSTGTPTTIVAGVAIGNGTATITGNDSVGTAVINAGSKGLMATGEIAVVKFHTTYAGKPIVQLTPTNQDAAAMQYYVVSAPGFFSIYSVTAPVAAASYTFNYFVAQ